MGAWGNGARPPERQPDLNTDTQRRWGEVLLFHAGGMDVNVDRPGGQRSTDGLEAWHITWMVCAVVLQAWTSPKNRDNAIKLLVRCCGACRTTLRLASLEGSSTRNALPRENGP